MIADVLIVVAGPDRQRMWNAFRSTDFRHLDLSVVDVDDYVATTTFDDTAGVWTVVTRAGATHQGRVVVTSHRHPGVDDVAPYLGLAEHGAPNYFVVSDDGSAHYIAECVRLMTVEGAGRIEVRRSTQQTSARRPRPRPDVKQWERLRRHIPTAFDMWSPDAAVHNGVYDGPAIVTAGDAQLEVRVRLTGHVEPIDGRYHWQGMLFGQLPPAVVKQRDVALATSGEAVAARIGEQTPWGGYSVAGVGEPPF